MACSRRARLRCQFEDVAGGACAHAGRAELAGQLPEGLALAGEGRRRVEQVKRRAKSAMSWPSRERLASTRTRRAPSLRRSRALSHGTMRMRPCQTA